MAKYLSTLLYIGVFLSSCQKEAPIRQINGFDSPPAINGQGLAADSFYVVPLESKNNVIISDIRKIDFVDSSMVILSSEGVFSFNRQGQYLCQYGEKGNGSGEYHTLTSMWVDEQKHIRIIDGARNRILTFNTDGQLLDTQTYSSSTFDLLNDCEPIDNNHLFCSNHIYNDLNTIYSTFDLQRKESRPLHKFAGKTANMQEYTGRHAFTLQKDTVFCVSPFSPDIYYWTEGKNDIRPYLSIMTEQEILSEKEQTSIENFGITRYAELLNQDVFTGFTDLFITPQYYFLGFYNLSYFLVNKSTHKGVRYEYPLQTDKISYLPLINIRAVSPQGFLVGFEEAYKLKQWKINTETQDDNLRKVQAVVQKISAEDNPCLFFYRLK